MDLGRFCRRYAGEKSAGGKYVVKGERVRGQG